MPNHHRPHQRSDLAHLAVRAMTERGLEPEFSSQALQEVARLHAPPLEPGDDRINDLRGLLWCSLDNDDSRDLDQLTVSVPLHGAAGAHGGAGELRLLVAVADVDSLVRLGSGLDRHARVNTTSVYTSARIFPMLPERLSTDLTSLNPGQDRLALVTDMHFDAEGALRGAEIYRARVHNQAQLAYDAVSDWLTGQGDLPAAAAVPGMDAQLRAQDALAQQLRARRHEAGSLEFESFQPKAVFDGEQVVDIRQQAQNRARQLIEEAMVAANGCAARFLAAHGVASLRRVVRSPRRSAGCASSSWRKRMASTCRICPTARRWRLPGQAAPRRPAALCRPVAGGCQADGRGRVRDGRCPAASRWATSAWRCATMPTPPRPTGAFPTWSPHGC